jgi:chloramphenicol O-acetyltransferase
MCANVDLTMFRPYVREHGFSFTVAIIYSISRAANAVPVFRYRIETEL